MTDHGVIPEQYLPVEAGLCVREGLPEMEALRAITINAAAVIGPCRPPRLAGPGQGPRTSRSSTAIRWRRAPTPLW